MQEEDRFSEASFGSVISLRSVGSDDGISPKPPSGAKKSKSGGKRALKVKKQDSPYIGKNAAPKKTGRELWVASIRQGAGMSAESGGMSTFNGIKAPYTGQSKAVASSSSYLLDQLLVATGRSPKNHTRASSFTNVRVGGNGPAYKTAEEYYDEVLDLKKRINQLMRESETIKSKMHKVEGDNFAKARQIEELINPNMQTNEMRRSLTDKRPQSSAVITSLKHKLHSMERLVKSKDNELSQLKDDLKYSDLAELQMQNEIYYQEIQRLTIQLTEPRSSNTLQISSEIKKETTPEGKLKRYGEAVQSLSDDNSRLVMENSSLKQDLRKAMDLNAQTLNLSKDVEDMNRVELLAKISQLEQQIREDDGNEKETETPRPKRSTTQSRRFPGKAGEEVKRLEERESELLDEIDKHKDTISKLKEDRTHYRKLADDYRLQLDNLKSGSCVIAAKAIKEEPDRARSESVLSTSSSTKKSLKKKRPDSQSGKAVKNRKESDAARTIQRNWRRHRDDKRKIEDENFHESISTIQAAFRGHAARERLLHSRRIRSYSDDDDDYTSSEASSLYEEDVALMQAAFRGHLSRRDMVGRNVRSRRDDSDDAYMDDPPRFQRSFDTGELMEPVAKRSSDRPYLSSNRKGIFQTKDYTTRSSIERRSMERKRNERKSESSGIYDEDDDDDDDDGDVVIGSTASLNSNDRFEQAYLTKYKADSSQNARKSQMSRIQEEERSIDRSAGRDSLNKLQQNSTSWGNRGKTNVADFLTDSENEDVVNSLSQRKKNNFSSSKSSKNSTNEELNDSRKRDSVRLANRWAASGSQNMKSPKKQGKSLITARPSSWQRVGSTASKSDDDDEEDDDDDLVIAPSMSKQKRKALEDELM